jgi:hypothetical protein
MKEMYQSYCLNLLVLLFQNTTEGVIYNEQNLSFYNSGGWEVSQEVVSGESLCATSTCGGTQNPRSERVRKG